jgi:hypothetical protein
VTRNEHSSGREAQRVADQVTHWTPARWRVTVPGEAGIDRATAMHRLIQTLADLCARLERRPARVVPRLPHDVALPDQLRVIAADLAAAQPDEAVDRAALEAIRSARTALFETLR